MTEYFGSGRFCSVSCANSKPHTEEQKHNISKGVNKYLEENGPYRNLSKNFKHGFYNNISCDSSWELAFVIYCLEHDIPIERNNKCFPYVEDGKKHLYFPDFIIDGEYYEIKGVITENTLLKFQQFPTDEIIHLIDSTVIDKYLDYTIDKYGEEFIYLYDKDKRSWFNNDIK